MKSVMISIQPKWCELIASGKKTVEVRKTRPKIETPFKCYIYCTISKRDFLQSRNNVLFYCEDRDFIGGHGAGIYKRLNGKVIGEFVCNEIRNWSEKDLFLGLDKTYDGLLEKPSCMSLGELYGYKGKKEYIYAWHISDLVIYDEPKGLSEVKMICTKNTDCYLCDRYDHIKKECNNTIKRPPQSWCYVAETM